jgi:hypothetical protein
MQPLDNGGLASNNISRPVLHITHSVTCDGCDGEPWPPPDDTALWVVVRRVSGRTWWRAIRIAQSDRRRPDAHDYLGGSNCHSK